MPALAKIDEREHAEAIKNLVNPSLSPWLLFEYDVVPGGNWSSGTIPDIFGLLAIERRTNASLRSVAATDLTGWRIETRAVGGTVSECRWASLRIAEALNEARLTVAGYHSSRIQLEATQAPAFDDGRYSALAHWTYSL